MQNEKSDGAGSDPQARPDKHKTRKRRIERSRKSVPAASLVPKDAVATEERSAGQSTSRQPKKPVPTERAKVWAGQWEKPESPETMRPLRQPDHTETISSTKTKQSPKIEIELIGADFHSSVMMPKNAWREAERVEAGHSRDELKFSFVHGRFEETIRARDIRRTAIFRSVPHANRYGLSRSKVPSERGCVALIKPTIAAPRKLDDRNVFTSAGAGNGVTMQGEQESRTAHQNSPGLHNVALQTPDLNCDG